MRELRPYQLEDIAWMRDPARPCCLNANQPGLGKTAEGLHAADTAMGLVVVCPKSAKAVWASEVVAWGLSWRVTVLEGLQSWRWPEPGEIVILNYHLLPWCPTERQRAIRAAKAIPDESKRKKKLARIGPLAGKPPHPVAIYFDESQALKNRKSKTHIRARQLRKKCAKTIGFTGTPVGGRPFDLYGMLLALGCCPWDWFTFLKKFNAHELPHGGHDFARNADGSIKVDPSVRSDLEPIMRRRLRKDVAAHLPPKIYRTVDITHKRKTEAELDRLGLTCAPYFEAGELPPFSEFSLVRKLMAEERIPLLPDVQTYREDLESLSIIFSAHRAPIEAVGRRPGWGAITGDTPEGERERLVDAFEAGELYGLGIVLQTAATAISLPSADFELFVDRSWDHDTNEQAEARADRMDRKKGSIEIEIWTSAHPVSKLLEKILKRKAALARDVLGE